MSVPPGGCLLVYDFAFGEVPPSLTPIGNFSIASGNLRLVDSGSISFRCGTLDGTTLTVKFANVTTQTHYVVIQRHDEFQNVVSSVLYQIGDNSDFTLAITTGNDQDDFHFFFFGTGTLDIAEISIDAIVCETAEPADFALYSQLSPGSIAQRETATYTVARSGSGTAPGTSINMATDAIVVSLDSKNVTRATVHGVLVIPADTMQATAPVRGSTLALGTADISASHAWALTSSTITVVQGDYLEFEMVADPDTMVTGTATTVTATRVGGLIIDYGSHIDQFFGGSLDGWTGSGLGSSSGNLTIPSGGYAEKEFTLAADGILRIFPVRQDGTSPAGRLLIDSVVIDEDLTIGAPTSTVLGKIYDITAGTHTIRIEGHNGSPGTVAIADFSVFEYLDCIQVEQGFSLHKSSGLSGPSVSGFPVGSATVAFEVTGTETGPQTITAINTMAESPVVAAIEVIDGSHSLTEGDSPTASIAFTAIVPESQSSTEADSPFATFALVAGVPNSQSATEGDSPAASIAFTAIVPDSQSPTEADLPFVGAVVALVQDSQSLSQGDSPNATIQALALIPNSESMSSGTSPYVVFHVQQTLDLDLFADSLFPG